MTTLTSFCLLFRMVTEKRFSIQNALVWSIDKWKHQLDKNNFAGAVVMDLLKVFDTTSYDLLIEYFHAYGFSLPLLEKIKKIKVNKKGKMNTAFST